MYRCFYSLIGLVFLLAYHPVLADELVLNPVVPETNIVMDPTITDLLLPAQDFFSISEPLRSGSQPEGSEQKDSRAPVIAYTFLHHSGPRPLALPVLVYDLVSPLLPRLTSRDPPVASGDKTTGNPMQSPWHTKQNAPLPRLDQVWQVAPGGPLVRTNDGLAIDGDVDLGLEVHAGSTKKDRATNAIKGMASSRVTLLPTSFLEQRFGRYLSMIGKDDETEHTTHGQLHLGLVTNGAYALNPNTKVITPTGEVVGTLSWMTTARDRFTHDPWRVVAFRWHPTVSCEGRSLMGEGKKQPGANRVPLDTLTGTLRGDLRLDFLSPHLAASGNYQYRQRLTDAQTKWEQATVSWKYQLNPSVSLGGSFTHGKTAPSQPTDRGLTLEMGVTF